MSFPIAIALSGGIDSLVAAALLQDAGHDVIGLHFLTGYEISGPKPATPAESNGRAPATGAVAAPGLNAIADQLKIPLHVIDLRAEFQKQVVDYFTAGYQQGLTPNPCLVCNPGIKFGHLFEHARRLGARALATGHYARVEKGPDGRCRLLRGVDPRKDQSYFLARLSQRQLQRTVLPLGSQTKDRTRQMAAEKGLRPPVAQESQDICFIRQGAYDAFLQKQPGFHAPPGPIQNLQGKNIGRHQGLHRYTIGQRRGINIPAARPYYVLRIDPDENRLIVGFKEDLLKDQCRVGDINWIIEPQRQPMHIQIRLRYRHTATPAQLVPGNDNGARISFEHPQMAVTPGQGAVFYQGDEVLGGGWIL